jgi:hypothetical protein
MPPIISRIKSGYKVWKKERGERRQKLSFHVGEQDQLDFITYSGLEEQPNHLVIDGRYIRTLNSMCHGFHPIHLPHTQSHR